MLCLHRSQLYCVKLVAENDCVGGKEQEQKQGGAHQRALACCWLNHWLHPVWLLPHVLARRVVKEMTARMAFKTTRPCVMGNIFPVTRGSHDESVGSGHRGPYPAGAFHTQATSFCVGPTCSVRLGRAGSAVACGGCLTCTIMPTTPRNEKANRKSEFRRKPLVMRVWDSCGESVSTTRLMFWASLGGGEEGRVTSVRHKRAARWAGLG